jgi:hypothetical protein
MVVFLLVLTRLIRLDSWTEFKKFPMKGLFVTSYGLTPMIDAVGVFLPEELDTHSGRTSASNLTIKMDWRE